MVGAGATAGCSLRTQTAHQSNTSSMHHAPLGFADETISVWQYFLGGNPRRLAAIYGVRDSCSALDIWISSEVETVANHRNDSGTRVPHSIEAKRYGGRELYCPDSSFFHEDTMPLMMAYCLETFSGSSSANNCLAFAIASCGSMLASAIKGWGSS